MKVKDLGPMAPSVSMATGVKLWLRFRAISEEVAHARNVIAFFELLHEEALLVLPGGSTPRTLIPVWTLPLRHISSSLSAARLFTNGVEWGWKKCTESMVGGARSTTLYDACTPSSGAIYLATFLSSAAAASALVLMDAMSRYDGAKVSGHVASQTNGLPFFHGTMVTPSGHLPSERSRPDHSNLDGILADDRARYRTSLMAAWR